VAEVPRLPRDNPLHRLYWRLPPPWRNRGAFAETWRFITRSERWSRDRMESHVEARLVAMVRHAAEHCPFYRRRFGEIGMEPGDFRSRADLARLPFVGRDDLRDRCEEFIPDGADRGELEYASTGGSSGIPVGFYRHRRRSRGVENAFITRYRTWSGTDDATRAVTCAGGLRDDGGGRLLWGVDRRRNTLALSSDDLTRENAAWMFPLVRAYKPETLRGYPSALATLASLLAERGETLPVRVLYSNSETLYEAQRRRIEEVFGAPVFDHYGHSERVVLAGQCERREGYHVFSEYGILELIDGEGRPIAEEGAAGEVVGTTLLHDHFPLIRYRTGDRAVFTARECSCGRPFPLILRPDGRLQELLVAADGRRISMTSVNRHDDLFRAVDQFQFHQSEPGRATLRVVPGPRFDEDEAARILAALRGHVGDGMRLDLERVERIEKTRIGKHRFLIQEIEGL